MRLQKRKIPKTITIDNPAWLESYERRNQIRHSGYCEEDFYPEDYDKVIPEDGAWIMLLVSVKVGKETGIDDNGAMLTETITVPHLSIWFAKPTVAGNGAHQAIIQTPQGAVHVWPHEYRLCELSRFLEFSEEEGFHTHFLGDGMGFSEEALFYLRSRGIGKAEAQRLLLVSLKDQYYCWFSFAPEIAQCFGEGAGIDCLTATNHYRRAEAHKRRAPHAGSPIAASAES